MKLLFYRKYLELWQKSDFFGCQNVSLPWKPWWKNFANLKPDYSEIMVKKLIVFNSVSKRGVPFYNMCYIYYKTLTSSINFPYPFQFYHQLSCYEVAIETPPNALFPNFSKWYVFSTWISRKTQRLHAKCMLYVVSRWVCLQSYEIKSMGK